MVQPGAGVGVHEPRWQLLGPFPSSRSRLPTQHDFIPPLIGGFPFRDSLLMPLNFAQTRFITLFQGPQA